MSNFAFFVLMTLALMTVGPVQAEIQIDFLMDTNPDCSQLAPLRLEMNEHKQLWFEALARPEIDLQRMSAESIALAKEKGISGLSEAIPSLEKIVVTDSTHPAARFSAARALVALDARGSAETLFQASRKYGSDIRQLVEPALASWDFGPIKSIWMKRLDAPGVRTRDFMLATRGLGKMREAAALPVLRAIVLDLNLPSDVRLESASAAGQLVDTGFEEDAERLIHEARTNPNVNRHSAIRLLARHSSDDAIKVFHELAADHEWQYRKHAGG
jgi:hypothetical protein